METKSALRIINLLFLMLVHQQLGTSACRLDPDCLLFIIQSVQWLSRVRLCNPMDCSTPGLPVHHQLQELAELMSIKSVMPSNHLLSLLLPSIFPSIRVFTNEPALHIMWPKYWSFSFNISPSNEYSGMISFRIDWFDFLAVQGTLESLL